jgi:rhamnose utilization protein RhaD (predicted bifunctional aldolase and dehydrogenase)/NAD(P)-dependent dehydrogenase (short-subunit alcohol dehydrogenase family)
MVQDTSRIDSIASDAGIDELVTLSRYFGSDPKFVIAGGGNTSLKTSDRLYVKGSGVALGTIDPDGFVEMKRDALAAVINQDLGPIPDEREARFKKAILAARVHPEKNQRPSVECVLHNMLRSRFVVHTHSTVANMLGCSLMGDKLAAEILGKETLWIPYVDPGFNLAKALRRDLEAYSARTGLACPPAVLMQNHGLIVCCETAVEIIECTNNLLGQIEAYRQRLPAGEAFGGIERIAGDQARSLIDVLGPVLRALLAEGDRLKIVTFDDSDVVLSLVGGESGRLGAIGGPLTPDQIVYCYSYPLWFEPQVNEHPEALISRLRGEIQKHREKTGNAPLIVLVKGLGLFAVGDDFSQADAARFAYIEVIKVMNGAHSMGGIRVLPDREREFIEHWEVEAYRRAVSVSGGPRGRASGLIAVLTETAPGLGLEIAQTLGQEGAHVVICDADVEAAQAHAEKLSARCGAGRSKVLAMDAMDDQSVSDAFHDLVRTYGGFDAIISNANIPQPGGANAQPDNDSDPVTAAKYKHCFPVLQKASPILALQHEAKCEYRGDIIEIKSKSGLRDSNRRGAHGDSVFDVMGITRPLTLDLAKDGIKVNIVCLGGYLDGPLLPDPETSPFVQYARAGEVVDTRAIEGTPVLNKSEILTGFGCTASDVIQAIYYLFAQKDKTGQVLIVTGG